MAAPICNKIIVDYISSKDKNLLIQLYNGIEAGETNLLEVIEALGSYLTSSETTDRCNSTSFLADLLHLLRKNLLNEKEVSVLVTFFCDRIKDHHSVQPHVLYGMSSLCEFKSLQAEGIHSVLRHINKELHLQSLSQKDRRHYYNMVLYLLGHRLQACQQMEGDFVYCYMQAMDGEKDPRNLLLGFKCVHIIAQHLPLGVFVEDLFEVVACYFPIDFTPPPNDPFGIKKEELVLGLRDCLSATPKFAEFCLPLLLEKATSSVQSAKIDAFQTLKACAPIYGALKLKEYLGSFWSAIEREVISGMSSTVETAALEALTALTSALSLQTGHTVELQNFIKEAFNDTQRHLWEPEQRLALPSAKLLQTIALATQNACKSTVDHVLPLTLELFNKHSQASSRRVILDIIVNFIKIVRTLKFTAEKNPLLPYRDNLYTNLVTMVTDSNTQLCCLGIAGIVGMLGMPCLITEEEKVQVVQYWLGAVINSTESQIRKESVSALSYISMEYPGLIKQHVLDTLLSQLKQEPMDTDDETVSRNRHLTPEYLLQVMASLSIHPDLVKCTTPLYIQHIIRLHEKYKDSPSAEILTEAQITYKCLTEVVKNNINNTESVDYFYSYLLPECFKLAGRGVEDHCNKCNSSLCNVEMITSLATVVRTVTCHLSTELCKDLADHTVQLFTEKESSWLQTTAFFSIKRDSSLIEKQGVTLLSAVLCSLPKEVNLSSISDIQQQLSNLCLDQTESKFHCVESAKCLAGLINKYGIEGKLEDNGTPVGLLYCTYKNTDSDLATRCQAFKALLWSTKAVVLSSHKLQYQLSDMVIQALKEPEFAGLAADGFYIILNEYDDVMSEQQHADAKIMYRQRFFHMTMPKLLEGFNKAPNDGKPHYLTALSYLLRFVPKQVLLAEIPPVIPLLIQSLLLPDQPELWLSTLNTVYDLMHDASDAFNTHISDIIPNLLQLAKCKTNMKVRVSAVQCIGVLSSFPTTLILPHRKQVIRCLGQCLDDHKRLVRKEVGTARAEWFLIGQPGK